MEWDRRDWIILLALTLLAAALRLYQLGETPPGFQFDEAFNAIDAQQVLRGNQPLFLQANAGREVVYTYWQAALAQFLGLSVYTLRLASALAGIVTIPITYIFLRTVLRRESRQVAAFTALALAISLWHLHFSRYAIRVILMPPILCGLFGLYRAGQTANRRWQRLAAYVGSGVLVGLTVWTHPTGRLVPLVLILYTAWLLWQDRGERAWRRLLAPDGAVGGLVVTGLIAFVVFLPLGLEFQRHPEFFTGHASEVSVFAERVSGDTPWRALMVNSLLVLGMFNVRGDIGWTHGLAGRPVFDPLLSIAFLIGVVMLGVRLARRNDPDRHVLALLAAWTLVMLLPSILSEAAPNFSRTLPALPAVLIPVGLGLAWIAGRRWPTAWTGPLLAALILVGGAAATVYDYFVRFAQSEEVYYFYDADKLDALEYLAGLTGENQVYLSQLWGDYHSTVHFLRGRTGVKSLDASDTIVMPPLGQGAVYAYPSEQAERAEQLASLWSGAAYEVIPDRYGKPLLHVVHVPAEAAAEWPDDYQPTQHSSARFVEAPALVGMEGNDRRGRLLLFWEAEERLARSLTVFVHLIDVDGHQVGQADKLPGNGSYPTVVWTPGERVVERYYPRLLDPCAGGDEVRVQVGWYEYAAANERRPRADAPGDAALAGVMTVPVRSLPPDQLSPPHRLDAKFGPRLTLAGYAVHGVDLQAGSTVAIDLYWQGGEIDDGLSAQEVALSLAQGTETFPLWEGPLAPQADWDAGEMICRRLRVQLPLDIDPGEYTLAAAAPTANGGEAVEAALGTLTLGPSTRRFEAPALVAPAAATLGEAGTASGQFRLLGVSALDPEGGDLVTPGTLTTTLIWQAMTPAQTSYKVFVHLVGESGEIVAQSDAVPADGYPTNRWVSGEIVVDTHTLAPPASAAPGRYRLVAGMYDPVSNLRPPTYDAEQQRLPNDAVVVGEILLSASH